MRDTSDKTTNIFTFHNVVTALGLYTRQTEFVIYANSQRRFPSS